MKSLLHRIILSLFIIMMPHLAFAQSTEIDEHADMMEGYSLVRAAAEWGSGIITSDPVKKRMHFSAVGTEISIGISTIGAGATIGGPAGATVAAFWNEVRGWGMVITDILTGRFY